MIQVDKNTWLNPLHFISMQRMSTYSGNVFESHCTETDTGTRITIIKDGVTKEFDVGWRIEQIIEKM